ncbi:hypothetical protein KSS87_010422 [Heliosperma pusillum]|nr:hypothetical protein KSS87_010422 [Heliosperma pusillum]
MNNIDWNFLDSLPPDVSCKILTCLDDPGDVVRATSVSRIWRDFVIANGICKRLCLKMFPQLSGIADVVDASIIPEDFAYISRFDELEQLKKEHTVFASLARGLTIVDVVECPSDALSASSTDNYPEEGIHNTLEPRNRIGSRAAYWSSSGQSNPEVPERLTYKLFSDFCVITEINVQPFQAFFQANSPIYSAKAVRFRMGYRKFHYGEEESDLYTEDHGGHTFTDEQESRVRLRRALDEVLAKTPPCILERISSKRCVLLPCALHLVASLIMPRSLGAPFASSKEEFISRVAHVQILGRPLSPVFSVNPLEPPGRFKLMFNSLAEFSRPRNICEEPSELSVTPDTMQRHVRGWEQILNMLRGTPWVEVYDSEDEQHDSDEDMVENFAA